MAPDPAAAHVNAGRLAQLLADTIVAHTPHTAEINAETTTRHVNTWLDGLEAHTASFVGPFLQQILDNSDPPPEVRALLEEAITPTAAFSSTIEQIFLFGIVSTILSQSVQPFVQGVSNQLNATAVGLGIARPVDPAIIATAAGRGLNLGDAPTVTVPDWAYAQAAQSGISKAAIDLAASIVGLPPALQELFEMKRRGIINGAQVQQGLREGDFRDDWIQYAVQLEHAWLTPIDFINAAVREQLPYTDAEGWASATGLDTTTPLPGFTPPAGASNNMFGLAFSVAGRPPGPEQLAEMVHRGIIPATGTGADALTFQQGIAESDVKTKWTDQLLALGTYVPPPEQTASLLERGGITPAQAAQYWADHGVPPDVVAAFTYVTEQQHVTQDKLLAKGDILKGYYDGIFAAAQATELLGLLGYRGDVATEMLEVQDFRREIRAIDTVVRKVGTLYEAFKISATDALTAMGNVGLPVAQAQALLGIWDTLRIAPVRVPTPTEIGRAVKAATITEAEGLAELARLGYEPRDAAIVLSSESGAAVTPLPAAGTTTTG